ncbi:MAG: acyl-CoA dehydrogenase family protein [Acidobacteriota bacterium]
MTSTSAPDLDTTLERLRDLRDNELAPLEEQLLREGFGAVMPALEALRAKVRESGLWTPNLPAEAGGPGYGLVGLARISEILGSSPLGHLACNCQAPDAGNMEILHDHGTPEQHRQFFEPLARGEIRSCFAMTEPANAGSNPVWLSTRAVLDGDEWVIDGHKWFTSSADGASFAVVMAVTDPDAEPAYARASQILVPTDTPGFIHVRNIPVMGEAGEGWLSHAEIRFEGCRVPKENLLGARGAGFRIAQERLGPGRIHHAMRWIGICERAYRLMCARAASRELAPGKPLGSRQVIQHWIAECRADIHAARLMVLDAAAKMEAAGPKAARVEISMIKFWVAGVLQRVLDRAVQVHGALGVTDDTLLSFWVRHERGARIYDGPDEVHKTVVARHELKSYGVDVTL